MCVFLECVILCIAPQYPSSCIFASISDCVCKSGLVYYLCVCVCVCVCARAVMHECKPFGICIFIYYNIHYIFFAYIFVCVWLAFDFIFGA